MFPLARSAIKSRTALLSHNLGPVRRLGTATASGRKEGDISSVFVSLSGAKPESLPERFAKTKNQLIRGNEERVLASFQRLLKALDIENKTVKLRGPGIIPQISFQDLKNAPEEFATELTKRGVAVIKGVIPEDEARGYKTEIEEYVRLNPWTKAFPQHDPQVYELYWSSPQVKARGHPNMLATQEMLMQTWHSSDPNALISTSQPIIYADRVRIRQPGDASFALGPHVDGGSVERWELDGYGLGGVYDKIWQGKWEEYDAWESSSRIPAVTDLYQGSGSCSTFRMFQGWLGLSHTAPGEGTLMVNPLLKMATAYFLLRPFFEARSSSTNSSDSTFLHPDNWTLKSSAQMDTILHGANMGVGQELNKVLHPHLNLNDSMIHVPKISPGDFVCWHCDTIHAVDQTHGGQGDSSVMYIPVCPTTESNAQYLKAQRDSFFTGTPPPDFPGGKGESEHVGRPSVDFVAERTKEDGLRAMGLAKLERKEWEGSSGSGEVLKRANEILGFSSSVRS